MGKRTKEIREDEELDFSEEKTESPREIRIRHQLVAELAAQGIIQKEIAIRTGYDESQVSRIIRRPEVKKEIQKYRERIYEDTVSARIRNLANPALDVVENILHDGEAEGDARQFSPDQQAVTARWAVEQAHGKAIQRHQNIHEAGGSLVAMMDRLDALMSADRERDVTPKAIDMKSPAIEAPISEEDKLRDWALRFSSSKKAI